jgi:hypothetical protein
MNSQNILKFFGTKLDVKLDSSEFYDYELSNIDNDFNTEVLDLSTPIEYDSLIINTDLIDFDCVRSTITLIEDDVSDILSGYTFSGLSFTLDYLEFTSHFGSNYVNTLLETNFYKFTLLENEEHYFKISSFNDTIVIDPPLDTYTEDEIISGFTTDIFICRNNIDDDTSCSPQTSKFNVKPWAFNFSEGQGDDDCSPTLKRRTEKGWTLDFVFNREGSSWLEGGVFYYYGVRGEDDPLNYVDNNLSFQFTDDGRIKWVSYRYSGTCETDEYSESYYTSTGETPQLCTDDLTKDFNVTIVFDRYNSYVGCDIENEGGWNDMKGYRTEDYEDLIVTAITSNQISVWDETERLTKKWSLGREKRLGTLKIYLNGKPIYKLENWEEVIPSTRGEQPFIQSWGGGTPLMEGIHEGICCFNIKSIKYYEEPLDFIHINHNFSIMKNEYDFYICGEGCEDDIIGFYDNSLLTEDSHPILTENNNIILY